MGFHTILTLAYLIPNIYLFVRIWQIYINKEHRLWYVLIYALLFLIYPVSNLLGEEGAGFIAKTFGFIAGYILPFFLYLFLFVLLTDLLLLFNLIFKIVPREKLRSRSVKKYGLLFTVLFSMIVVIAGIINFNTIRTTKYSISIPGKSSDLSRLKVVFVSDFHLQEGTGIRFVEKFVKKVESINPDLILFGGDIVEGDRENENLERIEKLLGSIRAKYGIFGVNGNHEHYAGQDKGSFFSKAGIQILSDSVVVIDHSFILAGRNDGHVRTRKSAADLLQSITDSLPVILLDHRPTEIDQISRTGANVVFSGHTHNGQLFPINLITRRVYKLSYGYMKKGNTNFFVSSGIRLWGPPVRTTAKSEIMVVDIIFLHNE
ncbi:MAG: metallophosphoesterase [Bacteroidia bacterium]|jgi:predicted MPP superfamily phosphohydrolase|nr:metallophosphoesterase [Bacteroidia bacterium]